jgi:hypothetical protein
VWDELAVLNEEMTTATARLKSCEGEYDFAIANELLGLYEEYEITHPSYMEIDEYVDFMVLHYITDNWNNNAKFLWKRIPSVMKKDKKLK